MKKVPLDAQDEGTSWCHLNSLPIYTDNLSKSCFQTLRDNGRTRLCLAMQNAWIAHTSNRSGTKAEMLPFFTSQRLSDAVARLLHVFCTAFKLV